MASIPQLLYAIQQAPVNTTGEISWLGTNGQYNILNNIVTTLRDRGVYFIPVDAQGNPDTTALSLLGASDARLIIVEGLAMYAYNSNGNNPPAGSVNAGGGGIWSVLFYLPRTGNQYTQTIGDSVSTTFNIFHQLDTLYPTVFPFQTLTGLPYLSVDPTTWSFSVIDANTITITYNAPIASVSQTIVVKK